MMRRSTRTATIAAVAMFLSAAGAALAQAQTTVTTTIGGGTRQLSIVDLAGQALSDLTLEPGVPAPFQVRVTDTGVPLTAFTVTGTMNNLYEVTAPDTYDFGTSVPAAEVELDYVTNALDIIDTLVSLRPGYLLSSVGAIDCLDVQALLGFDNTAALTDNLCVLLGGIAGLNPVTITDVPFEGIDIEDISIETLLDTELPVTVDLLDLTEGPFTVADCVNGIAAGDGSCGGTTGTPYTVLTGTPIVGALSGALDTLLDGALNTGDIAGTAAGDIAEASAIVTALMDSADTATSDFGQALATYGTADQETLINALFAAVAQALDAADLLATTGIYSSFPRLTVNPTTATAGSYAGTLTVTLIE